ncbi:MAG: DUF2079 domain-containing protein [Patescibacteria group bacterium]|nr:DUF2079 domain-containing protein [Patescibacteria group bacterium]
MIKKLFFLSNSHSVSAFLLATLFLIIFSNLSIYKHLTYNSAALDLGIYVQASFLYGHLQIPYSTILHQLTLADHFGPIMLLLSPIYTLFPSAVTLLIIQAAFVAFSSIPIFLIAQDKLKNILISFLITLAYLTSPGLLSAIGFDFHLATISVLPLSWLLYAWYFKKWNLYWLVLVLCILFKEDVPVFIFGLGIFQILQKEKKIGLITAIFAVFSFYLIKFTIIPWLSPGSENLDIGTSILPLNDPLTLGLLFFTHPTIFSDLLFNSPIKINTLDFVYRQFAFLSILSPLSWLTVFPALYLRFTSTIPNYWGTAFHYNANLQPFLAVSAILGIAKFHLPQKVVFYLLLFFLVFGSLSPFSAIWVLPQLNIADGVHFGYLNQALLKIPSNEAVSAQSPIVPHIANREKIYMFPDVYDAQYIILDEALSSYPMRPQTVIDDIAMLKKSPDWQLEMEIKRLVIFKKKDKNKEVPQTF